MLMKRSVRLIVWCFIKRGVETDVRVRFAPSPTGKLHLGGLRTALFNYLFAKSSGGKFILRIEDTDQQRLLEGASEKFQSVLDEFGLYRDEGPLEGGAFGPYFQSQRTQRYKDAVDELVDRKYAYYCFCSHERLDMLRRIAARRKEAFQYDNHCRQLSPEEIKTRLRNNDPYVIRFKLDRKNITFQDVNYGEISHCVEEGDYVLLKSDGYPTYHFANVVDDHLMKISHVLRGMEWIPSTPKHVELYRAFGWAVPQYIHLPLITRNGTKKLSKRDKDAFVDYYTEEKGYVPIAVLNFLLRNGSGIREFDCTHLYTLEEMVANFDIQLIGRRNFMMDEASLNMYGRLAFMHCDYETTLLPYTRNYFHKSCASSDIENVESSGYIQHVLEFIRHRGEKFAHLSQLLSGSLGYFFGLPNSSQSILENFDADTALKLLKEIGDQPIWDNDSLKVIAEKNKVAYSKLMLLIRLSLINSQSGPPVKDLVEFFGRKECLKRILSVIEMLAKDFNSK